MAANLADRVQFIDENDGRRPLSGLLEHIANASRSDADEQFNEVRPRQTEEWNPCFTRNGFCQQSLTSSWWADEQYAARNSPAKRLVFRRVTEKLNDLTQFFDGFINPCDIVEGDAQVFLYVQFAATATECDGRSGSTHASHDNEQKSNDQRSRQAKVDKVAPERFVFVLVGNLGGIQKVR